MLFVRRKPELTLRCLSLFVQRQNYSKDYSSSDDEKDAKSKPKVNATPESAATRLNRLLASMQADDNKSLGTTTAESMARPGEGHKKRKDAAKQEAASKDVVAAAKRVAALLGEENQKQTESELLAKLLGHDSQEEREDGAGIKNNTLSKGQESDLSLSELIVGMKIDRSNPKTEPSRSDFVRRTLAGKRTTHNAEPGDGRTGARRFDRKRQAETFTGSVNLFGGEPLGIFKDTATLRDSVDMLGTWAHLQQHELKLQVTHPPANYFEKMALWTEQGKVWRFPIDNEQNWSAEVDVDFTEHIFLEQYLEPWCPNRGPIRHFMELVCVGLSKNPYITAADKKDHIHWYRDYFSAKKDLLKDLIGESTPPKAKRVDA